ncbi:hypothetical protein [Paragemmobacter straminiformis]|uniref:Sulfotransferase family protein n=1 Tax=Paragemmobacter straminiformis TaxID=2045119 RepID=A0A842I7Q4_9RHOB|nr:hypothetical protein [Gemmobacter straminiformis]MBC2835870.1 hypothetical protein [Gemmobacter straminiformis]
MRPDDVPEMPAEAAGERFIFTGKPAIGGRPVPFQPKGNALPVFFLHIPRTSGGTVLRYLGKFWGPQAVVDGAETLLPQLLARRSETMATDVVSGHVPLVRWEFFTGSSAYRRVTVLRDPWARLVSHINCIGRFNDGEPIPPGPWAASWKTMAAAVSRTDFASRASMERLVRLWSPVEGGFDNLQVRMLLTGSMASMVKALVPRDVERAVQNLDTFSVVGLCEDQAGLQRRLGVLAGAGKSAPLVAFENAGKPSVLSVRNDLAREVLEPWFIADLELYTKAKAIAARQPG